MFLNLTRLDDGGHPNTDATVVINSDYIRCMSPVWTLLEGDTGEQEGTAIYLGTPISVPVPGKDHSRIIEDEPLIVEEKLTDILVMLHSASVMVATAN